MELADKARIRQVPLSTPERWREFDRKYLSSLRGRNEGRVLATGAPVAVEKSKPSTRNHQGYRGVIQRVSHAILRFQFGTVPALRARSLYTHSH